jgi:hypothetical protein
MVHREQTGHFNVLRLFNMSNYLGKAAQMGVA